mgnify:CR=1 FL=1
MGWTSNICAFICVHHSESRPANKELHSFMTGYIHLEHEQKKEKYTWSAFAEEELAVCAFIQNIIARAGEETLFIRYRRNSSNYVEASCLYPFLKFKFARKGKYIILPKQFAHHGFEVEDCTVTSGIPLWRCPWLIRTLEFSAGQA